MKQLTRQEAIEDLMSKKEMKNDCPPKLAERVRKSYENLKGKDLADVYWYALHEDVRVLD